MLAGLAVEVGHLGAQRVDRSPHAFGHVDDEDDIGEFNRDFLTAVQQGKDDGKTAAETAASLDLPPRYANYAMSRGTLTSAEQNAEKIYAELDAVR